MTTMKNVSRGNPRMKIFQPTEMSSATGRSRVHMLNLSVTGALVHTLKPPEVGESLELAFAGAFRAARVIWADGSRFGIAFDEPLTDGQVLRVVSAQRALVADASRRVGMIGA